MAEIGVLELSIQDNSESAGDGLKHLADALSDVKQKASGGLGLASIKTELTKFTSGINAAKTTSPVFQGIAAFGKGLADVARVVKSSQEGFDTSKIVAAITNMKDAIGDGMRLGTAGTQIKNIREALTGEWNTDNAYQAGIALSAIGEGARSMAGASLGTKAKDISAVAKALSEYADSAIKVQNAVNVGQMSVETGQNVGAGAAQGIESQKSAVEVAALDLANAIIKAIQDKLDEHSPSRVTEEQGRFAGLGLANGLMAVKGEIQRASEEVAETIQQAFYNKLNIMDFVSGSSDHLRDAFYSQTVGVKDYKNAVDAVLPRVQEMSSEQMLVAGNAKMATEAITNLIKRMDEWKNKKRIWKGFSEYVDAVTGVAGSNTPSLINENTTMFKPIDEMADKMDEIKVRTEGTIRIFDEASGSWKDMTVTAESLAKGANETSESLERVSSAVQEAVSLMDIPASGKNGMFANASEEMKYLTEQIEKAKLAQQQFNDIAAKAEKQIKYGGPMSKDELAFNLQHATEGFYQAATAEETYQGALRELMTYVAQASEEVQRATETTTELPVTQAIEELSETMNESTNGGMEAFQKEMDDIVNSTTPALSKIELLQNKVAFLKQKLSALYQAPSTDANGNSTGRDNAINNTLLQIGQVNEQIDKLVQKAHEAQEAMQFDQMKSAASGQIVPWSMDDVSNLVEQYSELDLLEMKLQGMKQALMDDINQNKLDAQQIAQRTIAIQQLRDKIDELKQKQEEVTASTVLFGKSFGELKDGMKAMFPTISNLIKRFKSMTIMRAMRYIIRQIAAGLSEGMKNVYFYSQAVGTSFAPAMDSAASALLQMKNSIGAAIAPVIQALIPLLNQVVSVFITLINYVNQFFALLRGQTTWTQAVQQTTQAYENQTNAANNAAKAAKDLLADWDELNIIQSQDNGGGGGGGGQNLPDYSQMFQEVSDFDESLKKLVENIKEQFGSIWNLIKRIGIAILGWKLSNAFAGLLGTLGALVSAGAIIGLVFDISTVFTNQYLETGNIGWLVGDFLVTLLGGVLARKVLKNVLGGTLAKLAIPLTFAVSAVASIKALVENADVGALSEKNVLTAVNTALKGGVAAGAALYSLVGTTLGLSAAYGTGMALFTFGATIGIKATADVIDTGAITSETIGADFLAAGAIGAGLALSEAVVGGTLATIATVGLGGALVVLGGLIGLQMLISSQKSTVKWGNYKATKEQIKAFVEDEKNGVFTVSPSTVLSIIDPLIEVRSTAEEGLTTTVGEVKVLAKKISIGISDDEVLKDLEKKIFGDESTGSSGLIGQFKETAKAHEEIIETSLTLVPLTSNDDGSTKELIDRQSDAWKKLTGGMDDLGKELSDHLAIAYNDSIDEKTKEMELKTINDLTNMMINVSTAMTQGEQYEAAYQALQDNLGNLTQGSWDDLFKYVDEYKKQIQDAFTKVYDEGTRSMGGLVAGLKADMENELAMAEDPNISTTEEERKRHLANAAAYESEYKYWKEQLDARREGRQAAIEDSTNNAMNDEVKELIKSSLLPLINTGNVTPAVVSTLSAFDGQGLRNSIWERLFSSTGVDKGEAKGTVETWLLQLIDSSFGTNNGTIANAIRLGFMKYGDVINKEAIDALASEIGIDEQSEPVIKAWEDLINDLVYGGNGTYTFTPPTINTSEFTDSLEEMEQSAEEATDNIDDMFASVQDALYGSDSTRKNEYNEKLVDLYANEKLAELKQLLSDIEQYGIDEAFRRMGNNSASLDPRTMLQQKYGMMTTTAGMPQENMGMRYENTSPITPGTEPEAGGIDYNQMEQSVQRGSETANGGIVGELTTIVEQLNRLLTKQWVVNINASPELGRTVGRAAEQYSRTTG